jgi:hypothetical protein
MCQPLLARAQAAACWLIEQDIAKAEAAWLRGRAEARGAAERDARERQRTKAAIVAKCVAFLSGRAGWRAPAGAHASLAAGIMAVWLHAVRLMDPPPHKHHSLLGQV